MLKEDQGRNGEEGNEVKVIKDVREEAGTRGWE